MNERLYEEVGSTYRFFLGWRHAAFGGNLVVIYGAASLTFTALEKAPTVAWVVPALAAPIGILLWIIDVRTRKLYHAVMRAGKELEREEKALFSQLCCERLPEKKSPVGQMLLHGSISQSFAISFFFLGSSLVFAILAILLFTKGGV